MRLFLSCLSTCLMFLACTDHYPVLEIIDLSSSPEIHWNDVSMVQEGQYYIVGGNTFTRGLLQRTSDGGNTWVLDSITNKTLLSLDLLFNGSGCAAGIDGQMFTFENIDEKWTFSRLKGWNTIQDMIAVEDRYIVACGYGFGQGFIFDVDENGQAINEIEQLGSFSAVHCYQDSLCFAVGFGNLWRSQDGGKHWEDLEFHGSFLKDVEIIDDKIALICDSDGQIHRTIDGGNVWKRIELPLAKKIGLEDMSFFESQMGIVVGDRGVCLVTDNAGLHWQQVKDIPDMDFNAVDMKQTEAILVGDQGAIIKLIF